MKNTQKQRSVQTFMQEACDGNRVIERLVVELYEDGVRIDAILPKSQDWADWFAEGWKLYLLTYDKLGNRLFNGQKV